MRVGDAGVEYHVEWEGGELTWEPEAHLEDNSVLAAWLAAK